MTAQAILRAKARESGRQNRPGRTIAAHADPEAVRRRPVASWRAVVDTWPEDWRFWWTERAAVMEIDGGLPREQAERAAYDKAREAMSR